MPKRDCAPNRKGVRKIEGLSRVFPPRVAESASMARTILKRVDGQAAVTGRMEQLKVCAQKAQRLQSKSFCAYH